MTCAVVAAAMARRRLVMTFAIAALGLACSGRDDSTAPVLPSAPSLQFVNGFGAPVDLVVDGVLKASALPNGALSPLSLDAGERAVVVRAIGVTGSSTLSVLVSSGTTVTVVALRGVAGALAAQTLDDSNAVVPGDATKLRVLHLAPLAGEIQVWRTQPDYQTPIRWAFPFMYNAVNTYYQSTPGTWEVRVWTDTRAYPAGDAAGWSHALDAVRVPLGKLCTSA